MHSRSSGLVRYGLRDGAELLVVRSGGYRPAAVQLGDEGTYLFVGVSGKPVLRSGGDRLRLSQDDLHVLRQGDGAPPRRIEFDSSSALAIVVFYSARWRRACPGGTSCKVGRFLAPGDPLRASPIDQAMALNDEARSIVNAVLALDEHDRSPLPAEMLSLKLLSWAFVAGSHLRVDEVPDGSLHPKSAMKARHAADILRQSFDNPPTISKLSALVAMNESDLKRCFKCMYGKTIASYSREKRLDRASDLLAHSSLSIAQIALEVGFSNPSQFARAFHKHFGCNPSAVRRGAHPPRPSPKTRDGHRFLADSVE